jgi:hypothetical protein
MAIQLSVAVRNAELDAIESAIGASAVLRIRSGSVPSTCATADAGTALASMTLPSDWMAAASSGSKALAGTWQDASAMQGTVTATGGGGDLTIDNTSINSGQSVTITSFTLTAANA